MIEIVEHEVFATISNTGKRDGVRLQLLNEHGEVLIETAIGFSSAMDLARSLYDEVLEMTDVRPKGIPAAAGE